MDAYIGLGSNLGAGEALLADALQALEALPGVRLAAASALYRSEPQLVREQPFFTNAVAALQCASDLTPEMLLGMLLGIEAALGRRRHGPRYGPRSIDLDLLLFGRERRDTPRLRLPHPRMLERAFVLVPLAEIAPQLPLPQGMDVAAALAALEYRVDGRTIFQTTQDRQD